MCPGWPSAGGSSSAWRSWPRLPLVGRYEYLDDSIGQKAQTLTLTSAHVVARALSLRLEYRGDFTQEPYFTDSDGRLKDSQHAVLVGLVFTFGGEI
jgi:hypothetical protein